MGCWHGPYGHGCSPWHGYGWYAPPEWYEDLDWPIRRSWRRPERALAADDLEARLDALRDEIRRVELDLAGLRPAEAPRAEGG